MGIYKGNKKIAGLYRSEDISHATEEHAGIIEIADIEETEQGTNDTKAVTPYKLKQVIGEGGGAQIDDDTISTESTWSSAKITETLDEYMKYVKVTVSLVGSEGNVPTGNSIYVYEYIDGEEVFLSSVSVPTGKITIKIPQGIKYVIKGTTDQEGFYMAQDFVGVAVQDTDATIRYTELAYPRTIKDLQILAKLGVADRFVNIGDRFNTTYRSGNTDYECPWEVIEIKNEEFEDGTIGQCVTLEMEYCTIESVQFDAPHQELATETNAIEGLTYVGRTDGTYTLLNLQAGDAIPYSDYTYVYHDAIRDTSLNIYRYGHNRYRDSAVRQLINSDKPKNEWYEKPAVGYCNPSQLGSINGLLYGFSKDFIDCVAKTKRTYYCNRVTDGSEIDVLYDKFFLLTGSELNGSVNENEGEPTPYYVEATGLGSPSNSANTGRIKYALNAKTSSQHCWSSSAHRTNSSNVWYRYPAGQLNSSTAYDSHRLAVACRIG